MDTEDSTTTPSTGRSSRTLAGAAGLIAAGALAGGILAGTLSAGADESTMSATTAPPGYGTGGAGIGAPGAAGDPRGATPVRPGETQLTGTTADKVKAAALEAVPGGTVYRLETDADGAAYEAHMTRANGAFVTVRVDKQFNVVDVSDGMGPGGPGGQGGQPGQNA